MLWYENIKPTNVYENIGLLLQQNPDLYTKESIVFCVNGNSGFGSQLTVLVQNALYLQSINQSIHCLGCFCINNENFKYHDEKNDNSFFMYFKYLKQLEDENIKHYFVRAELINNYPFIEPQSKEGLNVDCIEINKTFSCFFKSNFQLKIGDHIINKLTYIKDITKKPLIGIHIRSILQIIAHSYGRNVDIKQKLQTIKNQLDIKYNNNYNIFFVTDVSDYFNIVKSVFENSNIKIFYNGFVSRIKNDIGEKHTGGGGYNDSIINLGEHTGFKLGSDIIYDCLSLIHCDFYFVSVTNIAFITSFFSFNNNGIHFN